MPEYIDLCSVFVPWCKDGHWPLYFADCNFGFVSVITVYPGTMLTPVSTEEAAQVEKGEEAAAAAAAAASAS
jgi:hypothetical protein